MGEKLHMVMNRRSSLKSHQPDTQSFSRWQERRHMTQREQALCAPCNDTHVRDVPSNACSLPDTRNVLVRSSCSKKKNANLSNLKDFFFLLLLFMILPQ